MRVPLAAALAVAAAGMLLLTGVDAGGSYVADVLPGMLIAGSASASRSSASRSPCSPAPREEETGMLSGSTPPATRSAARSASPSSPRSRPAHGRAGSAAALAGGIGDAFLVAGDHRRRRSVLALAILPSAASFLPKLRLSPPIAVH